MLHIFLILTTHIICSDTTYQRLDMTLNDSQPKIGGSAHHSNSNYFFECMPIHSALENHIQKQINSKHLKDTGFNYLLSHIQTFTNAFESLQKRFPHTQLLNSFKAITEVQLHATNTVSFNEDCDSLKEFSYTEWKALSAISQNQIVQFLNTHESFFSIYLLQNINNPHNYSEEKLKTLHDFSLHYLLISNMYDLAKEHEKELKKLNNSFSIYNCLIQ